MCIHSSIQNKTDIVGSFLRPDRLKKAREQFAKKEITAEELKKVEDEEIINLVENQKKAGLTALSDGEFLRTLLILNEGLNLKKYLVIKLIEVFLSISLP